MPMIGEPNIWWQESEIAILKEKYSTTLVDELLKFLPERNWNAIKKKAKKLGLKREIPYFIERLAYEPTETDLTLAEVGWAAGFIDGEGTVSIRKARVEKRKSPTYTTFVQASNTKIEALYRLQAMFGGSVHPTHPPNRGWSIRPLFHWAIASRKAVRCLGFILPYLCLKNEQTRLCLELDRIQQSEKHFHQITQQDLTKEQIEARDILYLKCRALNFKGRESKDGGFQPSLVGLVKEGLCPTYLPAPMHGSKSS